MLGSLHYNRLASVPFLGYVATLSHKSVATMISLISIQDIETEDMLKV